MVTVSCDTSCYDACMGLDVTEPGSKRFLQAVFDAMQYGISVLDQDLTVLRVNEWIERMYASRAPLVGEKCYAVYQDRSSPCPWCPSLTALETGETETRIVPYPSTENPSGWIELTSYPLRDECGEIVGVIEHVKDITQRKVAEDKLRMSEAMYSALVNGSSDGIVLIKDGRIRFVNPASQSLLGYSPEELEGTDFLDHVAPASASLVAERYAFRMEGRDAPMVYEVELLKKDGSAVDVEVSVTRLSQQDGAALLVFLRDLSHRRAAESALQARDRQYAELFENTRDAVFTTDRAGTMTDANDAALRLFGCDRRQFIGRAASEFYVEPNRRNDLLRALREDGAVKDFEVTLKTADGKPLQCLVTANARQDGDTRVIGYHGIIRDVTEQRAEEAKREEALEEVIALLGRTTETRDSYTAEHQRRVTELAILIGQRLGMEQVRLAGLRHAGLVHDIGKIAVPIEILSKPTALTDVEYGILMGHCQVGADILSSVRFLEPIAEVVLQHHERIDGSGYPRGLRGDETCLEARILGVADVVEAIMSDRPYRPALGTGAAIDELNGGRAAKYDERVVDACLEILELGDFPDSTGR